MKGLRHCLQSSVRWMKPTMPTATEMGVRIVKRMNSEFNGEGNYRYDAKAEGYI